MVESCSICFNGSLTANQCAGNILFHGSRMDRLAMNGMPRFRPYLTECGVGMNGVRNLPDLELAPNSHRSFGDQFSGTWADHGRAEQPIGGGARNPLGHPYCIAGGD